MFTRKPFMISVPIVAAFAQGASAGVPAPKTLDLVTDNQQQQIEIEVGPVAGEVRVYGIDGIRSGTTYTGIAHVNLTTGSAFDFVEFRIFATVVPSIMINTNAGDSDVKIIYETPTTPDPVWSEVAIFGHSGNDKAGFEVISEAASFGVSWDVRHGDGDNETTAAVLTDRFADALSVDLYGLAGSGQDKLTASVITGASNLNVSVAGALGGGNDQAVLTIDEKRASSQALALDLDMGAGEDVAEVIAVLRGGIADLSGLVAGGADKDTLKLLFEGDGVSSITLDGGDGPDVLDSEYKGLALGSPQLLGGTGDDYLKIVAKEAVAMVPFIDGGRGYDIAIGFGTIVNVEEIN